MGPFNEEMVIYKTEGLSPSVFCYAKIGDIDSYVGHEIIAITNSEKEIKEEVTNNLSFCLLNGNKFKINSNENNRQYNNIERQKFLDFNSIKDLVVDLKFNKNRSSLAKYGVRSYNKFKELGFKVVQNHYSSKAFQKILKSPYAYYHSSGYGLSSNMQVLTKLSPSTIKNINNPRKEVADFSVRAYDEFVVKILTHSLMCFTISDARNYLLSNWIYFSFKEVLSFLDSAIKFYNNATKVDKKAINKLFKKRYEYSFEEYVSYVRDGLLSFKNRDKNKFKN